MIRENSRFRARTLIENIQKLRIIGCAGIVINILLLFLAWRSTGLEGLLRYDSLVRYAWILATVLFLGMTARVERSGSKISFLIFFYGAVLLCLVFSAMITANYSEHAGYTYVYIINTLLVGAFLLLTVPEFIILAVPGLVVLIIGLVTRDVHGVAARGILVNVIAITLFSGALSRYTYGLKHMQFETERQLKAANRELATLVNQDGLTGLPNRRKLDERISFWSSLLARRPHPFAVIMVDVDLFKLYNDTYGHLAGDDCLRGIASCIGTAVMRETDFAGRFGGEEFLVLLPESTYDGALLVAERIRELVAARAIPHRLIDSGLITVSLGVAWSVSCTKDGLVSLVENADRCLYRAKLAGRNRTVIQDMSVV
jgi:diguanylate cyclase (GGDEF)-like protein